MRKNTHYARTCALPAIAAALALSSTPLLAQEAQPVTEPVPEVTPPAPTMDAAPAPEATPADDAAPTASEPAAAATTTTTVKRMTRSTAAKLVAKANPVRTASAEAPARPAPLASEVSSAPASESAVTPLVDTATPAPAATPATAQVAPAPKENSDVPVVAGGALALLALGGGAFAIARRRRDEDEDVWIEDEMVADEPAAAGEPRHDGPVSQRVYDEQPKIIAPAFSWGTPQQGQPVMQPGQSGTGSVSDDDRMPGESWVDRAYRGPTPNNPSASLRNRLKRAAFFDKREREVAAGTAEPVDMDAGLPDAMTEDREREFA